MAEDPKIVPSPPPAEPRDVQIIPDPPPAEPFDVKVSLSPPPWEPFDVLVTPDPPPAQPFDVAVSPDGPPIGAFDVPTTPSGPPSEPFQVATNPDAPPMEPIQVQITPDLPPSAPFDVQTVPDGPPSEPFDVVVTPDLPPMEVLAVEVEHSGPPAEPLDVSITQDAPPSDPFNVNVELSPPPAPPNVIRDHRNPGVPALPYPFTEKPTTQQLIDAVKDYDKQLANFLVSVGDATLTDTFSTLTPYGGALSPLVLADWFASYVGSVGKSGIARFIAEQGTLYAMNVVGRVFNPAYFVAMLVPGSMGNFPPAVDVAAGNTAATMADAKDRLLIKMVRANPNRPGGNGLNDRPDVFGPENTADEGSDFSISEVVDSLIDGQGHPYISSNDKGDRRFDAARYFDSNGAAKVSVKQRAALGSRRIPALMEQSAHVDGIVRLGTLADDEDGAVSTDSQNSLEGMHEDETRVPLSFTDLRRDPISNKFRSVFFRPMNLSIGESISPQYSETNSFGRVDTSVSYSSTARTFSVGFEQHVFAPEDLELMYKKLTMLKSMCYPTYGSDALLRSGPVVRMRIGDLVSTEEGGLGGVIKNLSIDYNDALWELKHGMKVPRSFKVTLEFMALHDGPVGILDGYFGVLRLPPPGKGGTTNFAEDTQPQTDEPKVATNRFGMFSKFGERRR